MRKGICLNTGRTHFKKGHKPWNKNKKVQTNTGKTHFKKRQIPWNKGTKGIMKAWNKGKKYLAITGEKNPMWKGGKRINNGYILILKPNHPFCNKTGYIKRSRFIMEKKLGRYLTSKEIVHHINEIKDDDRIENLMLFKNIAEHIKYHCSIRNRRVI